MTSIQNTAIEKHLKSMMWKFSAGVNYRRPLAEQHNSHQAQEEKWKSIWDMHTLPHVENFARDYVMKRLVL
eukprot:CAMPEP_0118680102 /NCGR_PEP_ID=MMETSP0800-20121206/4164_1 /TAXON_ID=210618 ORGANISM="Striatella unipunctata, Strain CCMP2910" /NCGR_SAMPLE_ID=MMETSP0800 /ASSEMBLY_ACC=CAM_ASM_000638 /LENGTH=70 /DNA_ID=CAMNT_0006576185 /DNA_START=147 /DNA_END=359 /DNA_ORIENTATION=-